MPCASSPTPSWPLTRLPEGPPPPVYPVMAVETQPEARGIYTVQKGAHLSSVAMRTHTALADLVRLNPSLKPETLRPAGTRVKLPIVGSW